MKHIRSITIFLSIAIFAVSCAKSNEVDSGGLFASVLANPVNDGTLSVVNMKTNDGISYQGTCYDSFKQIFSGTSVSGTTFYNATLGFLHIAPPLESEKSSKSTCSSLGFSGSGILEKDANDNFEYKLYYCNTDIGACSYKGIQASGL
ncbi:hypothetical protein EHQ53_09155 [Leptospira langatensis]|uniref:Lipoprotein n=1 Tax=Leptospira langatensis TaxID=2484983 RepID=A0A5F1ZXM9_9LEPT|nr:hypothetical protein [Leptospira langatensis]TGK01215.1 hypothetical protein EHO57_09720 [Leptospira langatensis]TGL42335.1 hypothetical protein EHQ53_09155 [Leptospira langatensis]